MARIFNAVRAENTPPRQARGDFKQALTVLALCTDTQQERFLLHALYDLSYAEIAEMCGCTKVSVCRSIMGVRKKFFKFWRKTR